MRAPDLAGQLRRPGMVPGVDVSARPEAEARDGLLFCVTEMTPDEHVRCLVEALERMAGAG